MRQFLRKYLDGVANQKLNGRNLMQRVRTYSDSQLAEEANPPLNAPKWAISGYNGPLKRLVASVYSGDENEEDADEAENINNGHERQRKKKRKHSQSSLQ